MKRYLIVSLILGAGLVCWTARRLNFQREEAQIGDLQIKLAAMQSELASSKAAKLSGARRISAMEAERAKIESAIAAQLRDTTSDVTDLWGEPPTGTPEWNPRSPFIWLNKDLLPKLPLRTVDSQVEITSEAGEILAINGAQGQRLNQKLAEIVAEARTLARSVAERTDEPTPPHGTSDERRVTIRIAMPQEATEALKNRYQATLFEELGEERGRLISDSVWTSDFFQKVFGNRPETISVLRRINGTYDLRFRERGSSMSGITRLEDYIPEQFLSFFDEVR